MKYITIVVLMGLWWLSYASLHREASYEVSEFSVLKEHSGIKDAQARAIMEIWHISDREISEPVKIFGD